MPNPNDQTALEETMRGDAARRPSADKLEKVRDACRRRIELEQEKRDAEERVTSINKEINEMEFNALPNLFSQVGIEDLTISARGNSPGYEASMRDYYHAVISAQWTHERQEAAFRWLETHKRGDVIKSIVEIQFGMGEQKKLRSTLVALKKLGVACTVRRGVPWTTLTALVKEYYQAGRPLRAEDLETLGATVGKVVKMKQKKETD